jgi:hypothetical protein
MKIVCPAGYASGKNNTLEGPEMIVTRNCHDDASYENPFGDRKERNTADRRSLYDRRTRKSKGVAYISIVGWICRREQTRRKNDRFVC